MRRYVVTLSMLASASVLAGCVAVSAKMPQAQQTRQVQLTSTPIPTVLPPEPMATAIPQDHLPTDQPWFFHDGEVFALAPDGTHIPLRNTVVQVLRRDPLTPLLLSQSPRGTLVIIDPQNGTHIPVNLPAKTSLQLLAASPDGAYLAATLEGTTDGAKARTQVLIMHLADARTSFYTPHTSEAGSMTALVWSDGQLYLTAEESATTRLIAIPLHDGEQEEIVLTIGDTVWPNGWQIAPESPKVAYLRSAYDPELWMRSLPDQHEERIDHAPAGYALAPNGQWLAFLRASDTISDSNDLLLYRVETKQTLPLATGFHHDMHDLRWLNDSQHLVIEGPQETEVIHIDRDGGLGRRTHWANGQRTLVEDTQLLVRQHQGEYTRYTASRLPANMQTQVPELFWDDAIYLP